MPYKLFQYVRVKNPNRPEAQEQLYDATANGGGAVGELGWPAYGWAFRYALGIELDLPLPRFVRASVIRFGEWTGDATSPQLRPAAIVRAEEKPKDLWGVTVPLTTRVWLQSAAPEPKPGGSGDIVGSIVLVKILSVFPDDLLRLSTRPEVPDSVLEEVLRQALQRPS